jgi:diaminopimelate decarboxylase
VSLIEWKDGRAFAGGVVVEELAAAYGTPLYIYDAGSLKRQYSLLRDALPDAIEIYYSIKANPHPRIVEVFLERGAGCEIASYGEYCRARRAGAVADRIVFAGPGKGRDELEATVSQGIGEIHLESLDEVRTLRELGREVNVSIRVNPAAASGGGLMMGGQATVFGFEEESLADVVREVVASPNLRLRGIHVYTGTQILAADSLLSHWRHALDVARRVADLTGQPIGTIDLGGGLGIPYFSHETELDLAAVAAGANQLIKEALADSRLASAHFLVEPGRFLAGPAGVYVARVRSVKSCRGTTFAVLDGGMNHHLAASGNLGQVVRRDYPILNLSRNVAMSEGSIVVVGPLCTPIDTLGRKVKLPEPEVGDLLGVLQSGAYGYTASPLHFLSHPTPAEVLVEDGRHEAITGRGCVQPGGLQ